MPRSINTDNLPKETDSGKNQDFSSFDDTSKSSLGDMFSPIRDGKSVQIKGSCSLTGSHYIFFSWLKDVGNSFSLTLFMTVC